MAPFIHILGYFLFYSRASTDFWSADYMAITYMYLARECNHYLLAVNGQHMGVEEAYRFHDRIGKVTPEIRFSTITN